MRWIFAVCLFPFCVFSHLVNNSTERDKAHKEMLEHFSNDKKPRQYAAGDLWGLRPKLAEHGVTIATDYLQYVLGNPVGQKHGVVQSEHFSVDLNWNLEKGYGLKGLEFHAGAVLITGQMLEDKTGNEFPLTLIYGQRTFIVNNVYIQQTALDGGLVLKAGRVMAGDDFIASPLHLKFISLAFDAQIALYANTPASGCPNATWGAFIKTALSKKVDFRAGVYLANENAYQNKFHGLDLSFNAPGGAELITEIAYKVNHDGKGLPGVYKKGVFYFTGTYSRYFSEANHGNYGTYISIDQKLFHKGPSRKQGLSGFLTLLFFPKDRNQFLFYSTGGLIYQGLIPGRDKDTTSIGIARGSYSSDLRKLQRLSAEPPQNFEALLELNYWCYVRPWFNVTPSMQYVINPKGLGGKNALVLGLQSNIYF